MEKIPFNLVFASSKNGKSIPFSTSVEEMNFTGNLCVSREIPTLIELKANLYGNISLICDRSGEAFIKQYNQSVLLYLSDGLYEPIKNQFYDVIECENHLIDIKAIFASELEMIRCDYHTNLD